MTRAIYIMSKVVGTRERVLSSNHPDRIQSERLLENWNLEFKSRGQAQDESEETFYEKNSPDNHGKKTTKISERLRNLSHEEVREVVEPIMCKFYENIRASCNSMLTS